MVYQDYEIILNNGTIIHASEKTEAWDDVSDLIGGYVNGDDNEAFVVSDRSGGPTFVLRKNIACIRYTGIREAEEGGNKDGRAGSLQKLDI